MSNLHPLFKEILDRYQAKYDKELPPDPEAGMDEEELEAREASYQEWVKYLNQQPSNNGPLPLLTDRKP